MNINNEKTMHFANRYRAYFLSIFLLNSQHEMISDLTNAKFQYN
ncbi:hypothetical protein T01_10305 [Trichinella spiralis]|uniref:Uncharacterized protein n=1 Tax=Trichinella spiralis TaxID=6334 RepID=A0A0V1AMR9_TRISP|nr:hypothetical protein T01_12779 [Trichinella spiralis]KRY25933.1 hypothetical protein T01_10305 [Trichinella spiralis]